jgi:hypothetical protein
LKEEDIKSAFELAMEKISDLPELTPEEIDEQKKKEYGPVGDAVAKKYLSGTISDWELPLELARHSEAEKRIVRSACIAGLCREMRLENERDVLTKAMKGLKLLAPEKSDAVERIGNGFWEVFNEFAEKREEESRRYEVCAVEKLRKLGISGSAVRPNLGEDADWKEQLRRMQKLYEPRLEEIRIRLKQEVQ